MYLSFSLQLLCILDDAVVFYCLPVTVSVAVMYHSNVDVISAQSFKRVLESSLNVIKIAASLILTVLPH